MAKKTQLSDASRQPIKGAMEPRPFIVATGVFVGKFQAMVCADCETTFLYSGARIGSRIKCDNAWHLVGTGSAVKDVGARFGRVVDIAEAFKREPALFARLFDDPSGKPFFDGLSLFLSMEAVLEIRRPELRPALRRWRASEKRRVQERLDRKAGFSVVGDRRS